MALKIKLQKLKLKLKIPKISKLLKRMGGK